MAIAFTTGEKVGATGLSVTSVTSGSITVGSGSNRAMFAFATMGAGGGPQVPTAAKWGGSSGTSMTQIGGQQQSAYGTQYAFKLVAPTAQTSTVYASWGGTCDEASVQAIVYTGVDQTTPNGTLVTDTYVGSTPSSLDNVTSETGDLVLAQFTFSYNYSDTETYQPYTSGHTQRLHNSASADYHDAWMDDKAGATSVDMEYQWTGAQSADLAFAAFNINASGATDTTITPGAGALTLTGAAPTIPGMVQKARPIADTSNSGWVRSA